MTAAGVSVIIPTHRRSHLLPRIVEPLITDAATQEVIVVSDGPDAAAAKAVAPFGDSVRFLELDQPSGPTAARQAGLDAASADIVLFLDDDALPAPDLVTDHLAHHKSADNLVVVGYLRTEAPKQQGRSTFSTTLYARESEGVFAQYEADGRTVLQKLWGGNFSIRRSHCEAIGLAVPGHRYKYFEDRDFGLRCHAAGLTGVFDRKLVAEHLHERTMKAFAAASYAQGESIVRLHEQHMDELGPIDRSAILEKLPLPGRVVLEVCRNDLVARGVAAALLQLSRPHFILEMPVAKLLRRVQQQRGMLDAESQRSRDRANTNPGA